MGPRRVNCSHRATLPGRVDGFSTIEMTAVVVVIVLLMSFAFMGFRSTRVSAERNRAKSAARAYDAAVREFMLDNANMPPVLTDSTQWATPALLGPIDINLDKPLMGSPPDGVGAAGTAPISMSDADVAPSGEGRAHITYLRTSSTTYGIKVHFRWNAGDTDKVVCVTGNDPAIVASAPAC